MSGVNAEQATSDGELLAQFKQTGSAEAFRVLVSRHGPMVYQTCLRVLGNAHAAEDAAQAAFIVLFQRPPASVSSTLGGWLYSVARKTALKIVRSQQRQAQREKAVASSPSPRSARVR